MGVRYESVRLDLDDSGFSSKMARDAALTEATADALDDLNGKTVDLGGSLRDTSDDMDRLGTSTETTTKRTREYTLAQALADEQAKRNRATLRAQAIDMLDSIGRVEQSTDVIDDNTAAIDRNSDAYERGGRGLDSYSNRLGLLVQTTGALLPAMAPLATVAVGGVAALSNQLGFAALAAGTAVAAFQGVGGALEAVNKAALQPTEANLEKARLAMQQLSPAARDMVRELHGLGPVLSELRDTAAAGLFPGLIDGLDQLVTLSPQVEKILDHVSRALGDLFKAGAKDLASDHWANFFQMLSQQARPTLMSMGHAIGDIVHGLGQLWVATQPLNRTFNGWIEDAAQGFDDWATGLSKTEGFQEFVDYVRTNGPKVAHAVGAIANAILQIGEAAAPLGGPVLEGIAALADAIADIADSPLGTPIMAAVTAISALSLAAKAAAGSMKLLGIETAATSGAMGGLTGIGVVVGLQRVGSNLDKLKTSMAELRADMESGSAPSSQTLEDFFSGLANQVPVIGGLFDGATDAVHRLGDAMGIQTRTQVHFLDGLLAGSRAAQVSADSMDVLSAAQAKVERHADSLRLKMQQERAAEREAAAQRAAEAHEAAQGFYTLADAVKKPELSLADLETRMRRQAAVTRQMTEDMQTAIKKGVDPAAVKKLFDELGTGAAGAMHELATGSKDVRDEFNKNFHASEGAANSLESVLDHLANVLAHLSGMDVKPHLGLEDGEFRGGVKSAAAAITGLGKEQARPKVILDGVGPAIAGAHSVQAAINALHDKTVTITVQTNRIGGGSVTSGYGGHSAPEPDGNGADGTTVPKTGLPYADRHLYMLADGERVTSNRYGQVDRSRKALDLINAGLLNDRILGLASGGTVGGDGATWLHPAWGDGPAFNTPWGMLEDAVRHASGAVDTWGDHLQHDVLTRREQRMVELQDRKRHLSELLKLEQKERDALKDRLDALREERRAVLDGVAGIISAGHDLLAGTGQWKLSLSQAGIAQLNAVGGQQEVTSSFVEGPATFASFSSALTAQYGAAGELQQILQQLKAKGFTGSTLRWLIENGATTIQTLRDFASQSTSSLAGVQATFSAVNQFTHQVGNQAAGALGINAAIVKKLDRLDDVNAGIHQMNQHVKKLQNQIDQLKNQQSQTTAATKNVGHDVANALDGAVRGAAQGGRHRPGRGRRS